jgi:hypothetical protein
MPSFYVGAVLLTDDSARMPRGGAILTRHGLPWRLAEAMKPGIDVVIVSYNNRETLRECVEPLVARPGVTVTAVRYEPHAIARHHGGGSAPRTSLFATFARSRVRFARLHAGPASAFAQRLGLISGALTHVLVNAGRRDHALGHATALWTTLARHAR